MTDVLKIELKKDRIFGLDILRTLAILFVVVGHGNYLLPKEAGDVINFFIFDGVTIFFVLSGFLIGGILIRTLEAKKDQKKWLLQFWIRRWLRTLPAYFLVLIVLIILNLLFSKNFDFGVIWKFFIFSQNIINFHPYFFPEAWSLSIEEWFYIFIPIIVFLLVDILKFKPQIALLITSIFILSFITYCRYFIISNIVIGTIKDWDITFIFERRIFTRLDSLIYGVIGAYINFYYNKKWLHYKRLFLILGLLIFAVLKYLPPEALPLNKLIYNIFYYSILPLATLFLLPFLSTYKKGKGVIYKMITYISLISYSMYLLNFSFIQHWLLNVDWGIRPATFDILAFSRYILFYLLTFLLSILLYKYVENPFMGLRNSEKK